MNTKIFSRDRLDSEQRYDPNLLSFATYKNNQSDPTTALVPNPRDYTIESNYYYINSSERDPIAFPNVNGFQIQLSQREVSSITLLGGVVPNTSDVSAQPFLILDIPEVNHVTSLGTYYKITSVLQFASHVNPTSFVNIDGGISAVSPIEFKPVKSRIDQLTINIRDPTGALVDFGTGVDPSNQILLQFRIDTRIRKETTLYRDYRDTQ